MRRIHATPLIALVLGALLLTAHTAAAADGDAPEPPPTEAARRSAIKGLKAKLKRAARSPRAHDKHVEILKYLESLSSLGGKEAGLAALSGIRPIDDNWDAKEEGVALPPEDTRIRDAAFILVEREHDPKQVKPLAALLEAKPFRRDADLQIRVAHALAVVAHVSAIEPLTTLIRTDVDAEVVDEAARALATYATAPQRLRLEPVKELVEVYNTTYSYMMSVRPEHKILRKIHTERWRVYGKTLRSSLQALTGQQHLARPQEFRRWWNKHKRDKQWKPGGG